MKAILLLGVVVLAVLGIIWTQQRRMMYFPFGHVPDPGAAGLTSATPVTFTTSDGLTLNGWFILPSGLPRFTVIVFNGNAGNRAHRAPLARSFAARGLATLLFDYRGFGGNPGEPSESGLRSDARAARDYVLNRPDARQTRLVYFGESLGAAVAVELAVEHAPAALVLRSPFASATEVAQFHYRFLPIRWLLRDRFPSSDRISRVRAPLLVIAGDRDTIVPLEQSRRLYDAANQPKRLMIIPDADHNDEPLQASTQMIDAVLEFLNANVN